MGTRLGIIMVTMLVCMVIFSGIAYASTNYTKQVPTSGMILKANPGITVYSDVACTIQVTSLTFPNLDAGNTEVLPTLYIKNTGNKALLPVVFSSDLNPAYGTLTTNLGTNSLPVGASTTAILTLTTLVNGVSADTPFSCSSSFTGTY